MDSLEVFPEVLLLLLLEVSWPKRSTSFAIPFVAGGWDGEDREGAEEEATIWGAEIVWAATDGICWGIGIANRSLLLVTLGVSVEQREMNYDLVINDTLLILNCLQLHFLVLSTIKMVQITQEG